jgi:hypothetical protein
VRLDILSLVVKLLVEEHVETIVHALSTVVCVHLDRPCVSLSISLSVHNVPERHKRQAGTPLQRSQKKKKTTYRFGLFVKKCGALSMVFSPGFIPA